MISMEKWKILTPLQKLPKNARDLGKLIVAKGFEKLPNLVTLHSSIFISLFLNSTFGRFTFKLSSSFDHFSLKMWPVM